MAWSVGLAWQVLVGLSWALWGRWRQQPRLVRPLMLFLAGCGVAAELTVYSIWEAGPTAEESLWIGCYFLASVVERRLPGMAWWLALLGGLLGTFLLGGHAAALASLPGAPAPSVIWLSFFGSAFGGGALLYAALSAQWQDEMHLGVLNILAVGVLAAAVLIGSQLSLIVKNSISPQAWVAIGGLLYSGVVQPLKWLQHSGMPQKNLLWLAFILFVFCTWWLRNEYYFH
nr:hypothetical protein [uncultured Anaeromusa sp.]